MAEGGFAEAVVALCGNISNDRDSRLDEVIKDLINKLPSHSDSDPEIDLMLLYDRIPKHCHGVRQGIAKRLVDIWATLKGGARKSEVQSWILSDPSDKDRAKGLGAYLDGNVNNIRIAEELLTGYLEIYGKPAEDISLRSDTLLERLLHLMLKSPSETQRVRIALRAINGFGNYGCHGLRFSAESALIIAGDRIAGQCKTASSLIEHINVGFNTDGWSSDLMKGYDTTDAIVVSSIDPIVIKVAIRQVHETGGYVTRLLEEHLQTWVSGGKGKVPYKIEVYFAGSDFNNPPDKVIEY